MQQNRLIAKHRLNSFLLRAGRRLTPARRHYCRELPPVVTGFSRFGYRRMMLRFERDLAIKTRERLDFEELMNE